MTQSPPAGLPVLSGNRVRLRGLRDDDLPQLYEVFSDPLVMRYWSRPPMTALDEAAALLADVRKGIESRSLLQWGISEPAGDRVLGTCTLFAFKPEHRRVELGYALGSAHWGKGLAHEAVSLALAFAFDTLGLMRIEADIDPRNGPSCRLVERLGFRREGLLRARWHVAGEVQDSAMYGLLREEFQRAP